MLVKSPATETVSTSKKVPIPIFVVITKAPGGFNEGGIVIPPILKLRTSEEEGE